MRADRSSLLLLACVILVAAGMSGCRAAEEKAAEEFAGKAIGADVDVEGDQVKVTDGGAVSVGGGQELPPGFPVTVPVYRDAEIIGSITGEQGGEKTYTVTYLSEAEPDTIFEWYMDEVEAKGWEVLMTASPQLGGVVSAKNEYNQMNASISETSENGAKTNVVLSVGPPADK